MTTGDSTLVVMLKARSTVMRVCVCVCVCTCVVCRYRIHGNMLYIRHTKVTDRGTYRCIIERPSGRLETADAPLGLYVRRVCVLFHISPHSVLVFHEFSLSNRAHTLNEEVSETRKFHDSKIT